MDFSRLEDIAYVAAMGAAIAILFAAIIIVVVKGKRSCAPPDVLLRVFAALAFAVGTVLSACAVLILLNGAVRIDMADAPTLVLPGSETVLPLPTLFVLLKNILGTALAFALMLIALIALIADCVIANKKQDGKKSEKAKVRSAEELKRDAEIERIRKLGASAVKKTSSAAATDAGQTATQAQPEDVKVDDPVDAEAQDATDDEADFDWRVDNAPKSHEFVGLSDTVDDGFDTFDSFDDDAADKTNDDFFADEPLTGDADEQTAAARDDIVEHTQEDAIPEFDERYDDAAQDDISEQTREDTVDAPVEDATETPVEKADDRYTSGDPELDALIDDEYMDYDEVEPNRNIYIPKMRTIVRTREEPKKPVAAKKPATANKSASTKKSETKPSAAKKPATAKKPSAKRSAAKNQSAKKAAPKTVPQSAQEVEAAATIAPDTGKTQSAKRVSAKKPPRPDGDKKSVAKDAPTVPRADRDRRLPVTRRYVILDRTNAVNIFNEYLKERDGTEKDKLKKNISTIIIK